MWWHKLFIMNGAGAQYNRHQNIWQKTKEGGGGGAQIPYVVALAFYNEFHQNASKIHCLFVYCVIAYCKSLFSSVCELVQFEMFS